MEFVPLSHVYESDLVRIGASLQLSPRPRTGLLTRRFYSGCVIHYGDDAFLANCVAFHSGNVQICGIEKRKETERFLSDLSALFARRRGYYLIRDFLRCLYNVATVPILLLMAFFYLRGYLTGGLMCLAALILLRMGYVWGRNYL